MSESYPCKECLFIITCTHLCPYAKDSIKQENIKLTSEQNRCLLCGSSVNLKTEVGEDKIYDHIEVWRCNTCRFSRKNCFQQDLDKSKRLIAYVFTKGILSSKSSNEKE